MCERAGVLALFLPLDTCCNITCNVCTDVWTRHCFLWGIYCKWEWEGMELTCDFSSDIPWTSFAGTWLKRQLFTTSQRYYQSLCQHMTFSVLPINNYTIREWGRTSRQDKYNYKNYWIKKQCTDTTHQSETHISHKILRGVGFPISPLWQNKNCDVAPFSGVHSSSC